MLLDIIRVMLKSEVKYVYCFYTINSRFHGDHECGNHAKNYFDHYTQCLFIEHKMRQRKLRAVLALQYRQAKDIP